MTRCSWLTDSCCACPSGTQVPKELDKPARSGSFPYLIIECLAENAASTWLAREQACKRAQPPQALVTQQDIRTKLLPLLQQQVRKTDCSTPPSCL